MAPGTKLCDLAASVQYTDVFPKVSLSTILRNNMNCFICCIFFKLIKRIITIPLNNYLNDTALCVKKFSHISLSTAFFKISVSMATSVKRRKLKWYGHVTQSSGLAKTTLQGTVQGGRQRGRQRKRWEDNIKEWTGLEWNNILQKAENREEWRKLVVKSTVVPQQSARLRDR